MFLGLLVTGITNFIFFSNGLVEPFLQNGILYYSTVAVSIALLLSGQLLIRIVPVWTSWSIFFFFAFVQGVLTSYILHAYTTASIAYIFVISALLFLGLAIYGFKTKKDLSGWRTFLFTAVIAVFISSIINMFLRNGIIDLIISGVALIVFSALTIYDNQFYKKLYRTLPKKERSRYVCLGALHMYINFIVIFLSLLRLFGQRR